MSDVGEAEAGPVFLPAALSQALVAFTIEFDNEFEHQMPHRTTRHGSTGNLRHPPWLVSMAMWGNCMRLVPEGGIPADELTRRAQLTREGMRTVLKRMGEWWGYLTVAPAAAGATTKASAPLIRPTQAGRQAQRVWEPLAGVVEDRWRERLGPAAVERLRAALAGIAGQFSVELPYVLPAGDPRLDDRRTASGQETEAALPSLLSKVLLAFALDFGRTSDLALGQYTASRSARLAVSANILRVLDEHGLRASEIPARTGVAKMTIDNWLGALEKHGYATVSPDHAGARFKLVRLTAKGRAAKDFYQEWAGEAGQRWARRFGERAVSDLRDAIEPLSGNGTGQRPLWGGLEPYPDCWRAQVPSPATLPHYPVISHRGGFPDGS